jgi:hypothetical protein
MDRGDKKQSLRENEAPGLMSLLRCELANVLGGPNGQRYATIAHPKDPKTLMVLGPLLEKKETYFLLASFIRAMRSFHGPIRNTFDHVGFAPFGPGESHDNLRTVPDPVSSFVITYVLLPSLPELNDTKA